MNKNLLTLFFAALMLMTSHIYAQQTKQYTLEQVIELAKNQSIQSKRNETSKEIAYWQYRSYRAGYNPSLNISGNLPSYSKQIIGVTQGDGSVIYRSIENIKPTLRLFVDQDIPWTGGRITVASDLNKSQDYVGNITSWRSNWANIELNQPLLAYNPIRWNKKIKPLAYEQSKRSYAESIENVSAQATQLFFAVITSQVSLQIAQVNLKNTQEVYQIEEGRYNIGTTPREQLLNAQSQVLQNDQAVTSEQIDYQKNRLALRSYLGISDSEDFSLVVPEEIPKLQIDVDDALSRAKANRAEYLNYTQQRLQAASSVAQAKGGRYSIALDAAYGLNQFGNTFDDLYHDPLYSQGISLNFSVPIMDGGRNRTNIQTSLANQRLTEYTIQQNEINFDQEVIAAVRQFDVLYKNIDISKQSDAVADERNTVSQNRYRVGRVTLNELQVAQVAKDDARRKYIQALQQFWVAYYDIRRLTLYDYSNNVQLYTQDSN